MCVESKREKTCMENNLELHEDIHKFADQEVDDTIVERERPQGPKGNKK